MPRCSRGRLRSVSVRRSKTSSSAGPGARSVDPRSFGRLDEMSAREGGCSCGEVRYRLTSEPLFVHCCHCLNCQRQTGSAFVINLLIETDRLELLDGEPQPVKVPRGGGKNQVIWRCPTCQTALYSKYTTPRI